jgi:N-methylhydantoinase A
MSVEEAALGIIKIANANMIKGISGASVERGYDLRDFTLVSFGGACGLHAAELAKELHIPEVVMPPMCGGLSALGLVVSDIMHDYVQTVRQRDRENNPENLLEMFKALEQEGFRKLMEERVKEEDMVMEWTADMRYKGQSWELNIPIPRTIDFGVSEIENVKSTFHLVHQKTYSYSNPEEPVEFVNVRVRAKGKSTIPMLPRYPDAPGLSAAFKGKRTVWFDKGGIEIPIYERNLLGVGASLTQPCIIEEELSTTLVPSECSCRVDEYRNLIISIGE